MKLIGIGGRVIMTDMKKIVDTVLKQNVEINHEILKNFQPIEMRELLW